MVTIVVVVMYEGGQGHARVLSLQLSPEVGDGKGCVTINSYLGSFSFPLPSYLFLIFLHVPLGVINLLTGPLTTCL